MKHAGIKFDVRRPKGWRGSSRTEWLTPKQAFAVFEAAKKIDQEFYIFLVVLCYTGLRLSEATLHFTTDRLNLCEAYAYIPHTKNAEPRGVYLPPVVVAALADHPRGLERPGQTVFRFRKNGRLYALLKSVSKECNIKLTFHLFRHTWGAWMRRYAGLDKAGMKATGAWRDDASIERYMHVDVTEEAKRAALLPVENLGNMMKSNANPLERKHA